MEKLKYQIYFITYSLFFHSSTIEKKIAAYFEKVKIGGVFCQICSGNTKIRKIYLGKAPKTLVVSFARFEYQEKKKKNWNMEYSENLLIEGMTQC